MYCEVDMLWDTGAQVSIIPVKSLQEYLRRIAIRPLSELLETSLRWLDWIFWGRYLLSMSINYVGMSKDMEKRLLQLYYIKMKISYDLGFTAIGVAMATQ